MVKSHRSPSTFFHQWPTTPSHHDHSQKQKPLHNIAGTPGSPFSLDPFGSQVTLPEPIRSSRPNSFTSATQLVHGSSTTPKIVLASPSTSTIHYLFPSSETRSNLSTSTTERPKSVRAKGRPPITARRSFEQVEKEKTAQRKILEGSFPLPPSRREPAEKAPERYREPLGTAKRVPSGTLSSMRTLKRQPSMADLGKAKGMKVDVERAPLAEIQLPRARELRRRSQSLSSPSSADLSPTIPPSDFGDPISFADVLPSPSYSNLDYSTAGSTPASSRRVSLAFKRTSTAIFPVSAGMSRGDTRAGLGSYSAGKEKAREDAARRLNGTMGRVASIRRSVSLRRGDSNEKVRPRSQSLSARSVRDLGISPPLPIPTERRESISYEPSRGIHLGDPSVDLGGRYGILSPASSSDTTYPDTTPSMSCGPTPDIRMIGKPLHPAFASEVSLLAPSSSGLGLSPASLPCSLVAEAIDLTETGTHKLSRTSFRQSQSFHEQPPAVETDDEPTPRRSFLLAQNTFYIPPVHPAPCIRTSKSSMSMRRTYTPTPITPEAPTRSKRPITAFSLCSPPDAIDPIPLPTSCPPPLPGTQASPFLSASTSLRVIFSKQGFVARSLSSAFERQASRPESVLKERISGPLEAGWRENVLRDAVSLSISSRLDKFAETGIRSSASKQRSGIPELLIANEGQERLVPHGEVSHDKVVASSERNVNPIESEERSSPSTYTKQSRFKDKNRSIPNIPTPSNLSASSPRPRPDPHLSSTRSRSVLSIFRRDPRPVSVATPHHSPISSSDIPPPPPTSSLLDELTALEIDVPVDPKVRRAERDRRIQGWREGVGGGPGPETARLDERIRGFVDEDKGRIEGIAKRT